MQVFEYHWAIPVMQVKYVDTYIEQSRNQKILPPPPASFILRTIYHYSEPPLCILPPRGEGSQQGDGLTATCLRFVPEIIFNEHVHSFQGSPHHIALL